MTNCRCQIEEEAAGKEYFRAAKFWAEFPLTLFCLHHLNSLLAGCVPKGNVDCL